MRRLPASILIVIAIATFALTGSAQAEKLSIAYWNFDDDTGGTISSQGVINLSGTLEGDAKLDTIDATRPPFLTGKYLVLDGDNDYVDLGNPDELNFSTGDWSIAAWVNSENTGTGDANKGTIFANGGDTGGGHRYAVIVSESNEGIPMVVIDDDANKHTQGASTKVNDGWHHVAALRDGDEIRIYVDGVLEGTNSFGDPGYDLSGTVQHNAYIGTVSDHNPDPPERLRYKFFKGSLDDVAVWDEALPEGYIQGLANGDIDPSVPVPEPSTLLLAALGLLGLWCWRKL